MQDPKIQALRNMAQDFNNAFGHDKYGTIGNDPTDQPGDYDWGRYGCQPQALEKNKSI